MGWLIGRWKRQRENDEARFVGRFPCDACRRLCLGPDGVDAFATHGQLIGHEVLATEIVETKAPAAMNLSDPDMRVALRRA